MEYRIVEKYFKWWDGSIIGYVVQCRSTNFLVKLLGWNLYTFAPDGGPSPHYKTKEEAEKFIRDCLEYEESNKKKPVIHNYTKDHEFDELLKFDPLSKIKKG